MYVLSLHIPARIGKYRSDWGSGEEYETEGKL